MSPVGDFADCAAIRLAYWRQIHRDAYGKDSIRDYRTHTSFVKLIDIDRALRFRGRDGVVSIIYEALRYAAICVLPFRKPEGYKILMRRFVLAPAPKFRSRLRA